MGINSCCNKLNMKCLTNNNSKFEENNINYQNINNLLIKEERTYDLFNEKKNKNYEENISNLNVNNDNIITLYNRNSLRRETTKYLLKKTTEELNYQKIEDILTDKQEEFILKILKQLNFTNDFDDDTYNEFIKGFYSCIVEKNYFIYFKGNEAKVFYIIYTGEIEIIDEDNNKTIMKSGDFFGMDCFVENNLRTQSTKSLTLCNLLCVTGDFFRSAKSYNNLKIEKFKLELLSKIELFKYIGHGKLKKLSQLMKIITFNKNDVIINSFDSVDRIYFIIEGEVDKIYNEKYVKSLNPKDFFGHNLIFFSKNKSEYKYISKTFTKLYILTYDNILNNAKVDIKSILHVLFQIIIKKSEKLAKFFYTNDESLYNAFYLKYYPLHQTIYTKKISQNKKICIILSGKLMNANNNETISKEGQVFGENIIDLKTDLEYDISNGDDEILFLEAQWDDIIRQSPSPNKINLFKAVNILKLIPIFSHLVESEYLELTKLLNLEKYKANSTIIKEGEIIKKFYIIKKGEVKIYENEILQNELKENDFFGNFPEINCEISSYNIKTTFLSEFYVLDSNSIYNINIEIKKKIKYNLILNNLNIKLNELFYIKILGKSRFGNFYLIHNKKYLFSLKYVPLKEINKNINYMQNYLNEKTILKKLDNPHIIKLVKTFKDNNFIYFLFEYIDGISLKKYIKLKKQKTIEEIQFFCANILIALDYIHKKKILHRDIRPENLIINKNGYLKLIDFDLSKILYDKDYTKTIIGIPYYLAPEIIMGKGYSYSADYWSFGVSIYEIYFDCLPFGKNCKNVLEIYNEILNKDIEIDLNVDDEDNKNFQKFLSLILSKNMVQRLCNFNLLSGHVFFENFDFVIFFFIIIFI